MRFIAAAALSVALACASSPKAISPAPAEGPDSLDGSCEGVPVPYAEAVDLNRTKDPSAPDGLLVPSTLTEALVELDHMLPAQLKRSMRCGSEEDMSHYHFSLGLWIRNNWGLWAGGPLAEHFRSIGVHHPDDMSGIILDSYWRQLRGKPMELDAQIRYYENYWAAHADPGPFTCPNTGIQTEATTWFSEEVPPDNWIVYHVVNCGEGIFWVYEKSRGWYAAPDEIIKRLE